MAKTKVVTFDGHDCVGKTSLISALVHRLTQSGNLVTVLRSMTKDFDVVRQEQPDITKNVWFYLASWLNTEKEIRRVSGAVDFVLVDRSYYSTLVLARVFELKFPDFLLSSFIRADFSIWVQASEEERLKRLREKDGVTKLDYVTINNDIIRKANDVYSSLGLIPINNEGDLRANATKLCAIITR